MVVARGWEEGEIKELLFSGRRASVLQDEEICVNVW